MKITLVNARWDVNVWARNPRTPVPSNNNDSIAIYNSSKLIESKLCLTNEHDIYIKHVYRPSALWRDSFLIDT